MSGQAIYLLTCIPFALYATWLWWTEGASDGSVRRHNPLATAILGLVYGVCWPILLVVIALRAAFDWSSAYARRHP